MSDQPRTPGTRRMSYWLGWGLSSVAIAFFLLDAAMKLLALPMVLQANAEIGFQGEILARELGIILLLCTVLYAAPPTATLGAILLTGYLGGAVAVHLRVSDPLFTHVLFGVYGGILVWGGLYLRDTKLRAALPLR
jgi:DoxX-like family